MNRRSQNYTQDKRDKEFEEQVVEVNRVSRTMAGGRRISFRATVVIGNRKGKIGMGVGKSKEVMNAVNKAIKQAKKSLLEVSQVQDTIPYAITVKYKGAKILLKPASQGTGIIAGGVIRIVADLLGMKNLISKSLGSANKISNLKAMFIALKMIQQNKSSANKFQPKPSQPQSQDEKKKSTKELKPKKN